jgi:hypothetical protein
MISTGTLRGQDALRTRLALGREVSTFKEAEAAGITLDTNKTKRTPVKVNVKETYHEALKRVKIPANMAEHFRNGFTVKDNPDGSLTLEQSPDPIPEVEIDEAEVPDLAEDEEVPGIDPRQRRVTIADLEVMAKGDAQRRLSERQNNGR